MKFFIQRLLPVEYPPEGKEHALMTARRDAGNKLYDILITQKLPAVVDIREVVEKDKRDFYREVDIFRIEIETNAVSHRHITMAHIDELPNLSFRPTPNPLKKALRKVLVSLSNMAR